jgi:hypothetical protein
MISQLLAHPKSLRRFPHFIGCDTRALLRDGTVSHLTNRWSQPLAVVKSTFNFMKQFLIFATLAAASGGSASSR